MVHKHANFIPGMHQALKHPPIQAPACLHYAKNGRSACRACKRAIAEGELKFGVGAVNGRWETYQWYHINCALDDQLRSTGGLHRVWKAERLRDQDREKVAQRFEKAQG